MLMPCMHSKASCALLIKRLHRLSVCWFAENCSYACLEALWAYLVALLVAISKASRLNGQVVYSCEYNHQESSAKHRASH